MNKLKFFLVTIFVIFSSIVITNCAQPTNSDEINSEQTDSDESIIDISEFNKKGFGKDTIDSSFSITTTANSNYAAYVKPILVNLTDDYDDDGKAVEFAYKCLQTATASLKRTVILNEDSVLSFAYKTDIYSKYDGSLEFYIDDALQSSYTGMEGSWKIARFYLSKGKHTVEWKSIGSFDEGYTDGISNKVYLDALSISIFEEAAQTLSQNFESDIDYSVWIAEGLYSTVSTDKVFESWEQYGDALIDTHGKVYALSTYYDEKGGNSTLKVFRVNPTVDSALTFEYKPDICKVDYFKVYVDGEEKFKEQGSYRQIWKKASIDIPAGAHTIVFAAEKTEYLYSTLLTNTVYLDNISLVSDTTEEADIYPKGKQETYVGGFDIQFTASALRSDGSTRNNREITWTTTGGTITENGLFSPGSTAGTYTVTATIDGKVASNATVIVHGQDYLEDSVTIAGETFTGYEGETGEMSTGTVTFSKAPIEESFSADGFFVLKGKVTNPAAKNYALVRIISGDYETFVLLKDDFYTRVWLRFGTEKEYTVTIYDLASIILAGECYGGCHYFFENSITYTVTNTHSMDNAIELMPSYYCQGDNFIISNVVNAVLAELPESATVGQKLQALHDWEIHKLHYDNVSLELSKRKLQDAVSVVKKEMGVCEGYANLYTALARSIGVRARYQSSVRMEHGWGQCFYNNEWKLLDITWDDPVANNDVNNVEKYPYAENYSYFLIGTTGINNDHYDDVTGTGRSVTSTSVNQNEFRPYALPGWY